MHEIPKVIVEIRKPRLFRAGSLLVIYFFGLLAGLPVLAAAAWVSFRPLSLWTYLLPLLAIVLGVFCLPIVAGNPYVRWLAARLKKASGAEGELVQLTAQPRIARGLRSVVDDADDFGWLSVSESGLVYDGDLLTLRVPTPNIQGVASTNSGARALFVYGPRLVVGLTGVKGINQIEFTERSSNFLPESRRKMAQLFAALSKARPR